MKRWLLVLLAAFAIGAAIYAYAGYYNGPLFRDLPARRPGPDKPAIVMLSGDMGDRLGMTPGVSTRLNAAGYAVVTVNSLTFFSSRRTANDVAWLIDAAMKRAMALGKANDVVLIGQSFGADMLHAGLSQFSAADRKPIRSVVLIVPGDNIIFRASPIELAGLEIPDQRAYPTASLLNWVPVTCIHGAVEQDSLCPELDVPGVRRITLPGGHQLHSDDRALAAAILPAVRRADIARSE